MKSNRLAYDDLDELEKAEVDYLVAKVQDRTQGLHRMITALIVDKDFTISKYPVRKLAGVVIGRRNEGG